MIIGAMFLFAGYQLYSQVTRDGTSANKTAVLSNKVIEKMREHAANQSLTCTSTVAPQTVTEPNIGSVTYTTTISCPNSSLPNLRLIKVKATYDTNKEVNHATYSK
jgi:hypothetical protein